MDTNSNLAPRSARNDHTGWKSSPRRASSGSWFPQVALGHTLLSQDARPNSSESLFNMNFDYDGFASSLGNNTVVSSSVDYQGPVDAISFPSFWSCGHLADQAGVSHGNVFPCGTESTNRILVRDGRDLSRSLDLPLLQDLSPIELQCTLINDALDAALDYPVECNIDSSTTYPAVPGTGLEIDNLNLNTISIPNPKPTVLFPQASFSLQPSSRKSSTTLTDNFLALPLLLDGGLRNVADIQVAEIVSPCVAHVESYSVSGSPPSSVHEETALSTIDTVFATLLSNHSSSSSDSDGIPSTLPSHKEMKESTNLPDPPGDRIPTDAKPYICERCPKSFTTRSAMRRHLDGHTRPYKCTIANCKFSAGSQKDLLRHLRSRKHQVQVQRSHDTGGEGFRCPVPGCKFAREGVSRLDNLMRHVKTVHVVKNTSE